MALYDVLKRLREESRFQDRHRQELEGEIALLIQSLPCRGRILVKDKIYAGRIEFLKLEKGGKRLEFEIEDILPEGEQRKIYHKHVAVEELYDIQKS